MFIQYIDAFGRAVKASVAPECGAEQAAAAMGWPSFEEITKEEYEARSADEARAAEAMAAKSESVDIINAYMLRHVAHTESFPAAAFATFAKAGLFDAWAPGNEYVQGNRFVHGGVVYETQQAVTAQAHQEPGGEGMLAVYRPLSADPETGEEPDGSRENPFAFLYGMDVYGGKHYTYEGILYVAKTDMPACVWRPGTAGLWQWEMAE